MAEEERLDRADPEAADEWETVAAQEHPESKKLETTDPDAADEVADEPETVAAQKKSVGIRKPGTNDSDVAVEADEPVADRTRKSAKGEARRISLSVRTLLVAMLITGLVAAVGFLAWLYLGARAKLDEQARQIADNSHAERIALDYAVDAARIDAKDLDAWKKNLVKGTTPELKAKLNDAGKAMEQILTPLQWNSTAVPLAAKVRSNANGIYVVDTFIGVQTKTVQAPDGVQSTATYGITIDSKHDWQISDVGGIGSVLGQK